MSFWERYNSALSTRSGSSCSMSTALAKEREHSPPVCKIKFNKKNELEIEHYGQKTLRLANVRMEKSGKSE